MNRIIRSNALLISSQSDISRTYFHNLCLEIDLTSEMAFTTEGNGTSQPTGVIPTPTNTHTSTVTNPQTATEDTEKKFICFGEFLNQSPRVFSLLATIRSIAFFTAVVVWAWTGKIEQVGHIRGKFVASTEQSQIQQRNLDKVNTPLNLRQGWKQTQVVPELDKTLYTNVFEDRQQLTTDQVQFSHMKGLIDKSGLRDRTRAVIKTVENFATRKSQTNVSNYTDISEITSQDVPLTLGITLSQQEADDAEKENKEQIELDTDLKQNSRDIQTELHQLFQWLYPLKN